MTSTQFKITVCSAPDYEDLIAELYLGEVFVALVSQEQGYDALDIELHAPPSGGPHRFKLQDFEDAVATARKRLYELRKNSDG